MTEYLKHITPPRPHPCYVSMKIERRARGRINCLRWTRGTCNGGAEIPQTHDEFF